MEKALVHSSGLAGTRCGGHPATRFAAVVGGGPCAGQRRAPEGPPRAGVESSPIAKASLLCWDAHGNHDDNRGVDHGAGIVVTSRMWESNGNPDVRKRGRPSPSSAQRPQRPSPRVGHRVCREFAGKPKKAELSST